MKILFKLTSRSRPDNFFRALDSIVNNTTIDNHSILCSLDFDDKTMTSPEIRKRLSGYHDRGFEFVACFGKSKNKIDAINRDLEDRTDWDILVNVSDDQIFTVKGIDQIIKFHATTDLDFYLHFRDTNHNPIDALCTLSIIGRKYFERDNYIYHPSYFSVWCDNESMEVAKQRGKYKFIPDVIFEHLHPAYGKAKTDSQYQKTESKIVHNRDHKNFLKRQKQGFQK